MQKPHNRRGEITLDQMGYVALMVLALFVILAILYLIAGAGKGIFGSTRFFP